MRFSIFSAYSISLLPLCRSFSINDGLRSFPQRNTKSIRGDHAVTSLNLGGLETSNLIATIDADIANISDNEFAPIFMGGILVMLGGVFSAAILGFILEKGDLYANIVADSYVQQGNDEEFWRGLSEEDRIKGMEILKELEEKKGKKPSMFPTISPLELRNKKDPTEYSQENSRSSSAKKEMDMFSDYE
jgi:hypothetical protein